MHLCDLRPDYCNVMAPHTATNYAHQPGDCSWNKYTEGVDWAYYSHAGSTVSKCLSGCDTIKNCTGFEFSNDGAYCSVWFGGACAGPGSKAWNPSSTETTYYTSGACKHVRTHAQYHAQ